MDIFVSMKRTTRCPISHKNSLNPKHPIHIHTLQLSPPTQRRVLVDGHNRAVPICSSRIENTWLVIITVLPVTRKIWILPEISAIITRVSCLQTHFTNCICILWSVWSYDVTFWWWWSWIQRKVSKCSFFSLRYNALQFGCKTSSEYLRLESPASEQPLITFLFSFQFNQTVKICAIFSYVMLI